MQDSDQDNNQKMKSQGEGNLYLDENQQLRELYMLRKAKEVKEKKEDEQKNKDEEMDRIEDGLFEKMGNKQVDFNYGMKEEKKQEMFETIPIYLNSLFFDMRENKPKFYVKIFSFFNDDPTNPTKIASQNVQAAFITTFGFQVQTFQTILTKTNIKLYILNDSQQKTTKIQKNYEGNKNLTVISKQKNHKNGVYGVFHSKLWLIKFKTFLRVVICTSNQHQMDWAVWLNSYWYQDFPLFKLQQNSSPQHQQSLKLQQFNFNKDFKKTLFHLLANISPTPNYLKQIGFNLDQYVYENIKIILIPSNAGRFQGQRMEDEGILKMRRIMKKFNKMKRPVVSYNTTSVGVPDESLARSIYDGFCPNSQNFETKRFKMIYPTERYIREKTGGQAQVLFLKKSNYLKAKSFTDQILHRFDVNPQNPILSCIPHLKTVFIEQQGNQNGILFMGSHNMTKAAWGKLQKKDTQLFISNSQLGILFFDVKVTEFKKWAPFKYPPDKYSQNDSPYLRQ